MSRDKLLRSECVTVPGIPTPTGEPFEVWVKFYDSGRTRILLPGGYEVLQDIHQALTSTAFELTPKRRPTPQELMGA